MRLGTPPPLPVALALAGLLVVGCAPRAALLDSPIVQELHAGQRDGRGTFDHSQLETVLRQHVRVDQARVDYSAMRAEVAAAGTGRHPDLGAYAAGLASVDLKTLGRDEQMALLINAYNAFTLTLIVEQGPELASIKELPDPWGQRRWDLGGHEVSLNDIEHGLLRPVFEDPRLHFAINCASVGCPPLRDEAFVAARLDAQLDSAVTDTLSRSAYAHRDGDKLALTSLLRWFGDDFTDSDAVGRADTVQAWVARSAPPELASFIRDDAPDVRWLDYDWSINQAASAH